MTDPAHHAATATSREIMALIDAFNTRGSRVPKITVRRRGPHQWLVIVPDPYGEFALNYPTWAAAMNAADEQARMRQVTVHPVWGDILR